MELSEYTIEQLREGRPDLVEALAAEHDGRTKEAVEAATMSERERALAIVTKAITFALPRVGAELLRAGSSVETALSALKDARIAALEAATITPVGPDAEIAEPEEEKTPATPEEAAEAEWEKDPELRVEFGNVKSRYLAFRRAELAGRVRFVTKKEA